MRMPSWNTLKTPIAFIVAPLACPLIFVLYIVFADLWSADVSIRLGLSVLVLFTTIGVYLFVVVLGLPIYLLLCEHNLTSFWLFPLVGYIGGAACTFLVGMPRPFEREIVATAVNVLGPIGAVVCTIIWLIARPDRQSHDAERGKAARRT